MVLFPLTMSNSEVFPINYVNDDVHNSPLSVIDYINLEIHGSNDDEINVDKFIFPETSCYYHFLDNSTNQITLSNHNLDISSIPLHLESYFTQCLDVFNIKFDVIGLCETHFSNNICDLYINNEYNFFFKNKNTAGGGEAIYLIKILPGNILENVSIQHQHIRRNTLFKSYW